jgi:hypothetical protein
MVCGYTLLINIVCFKKMKSSVPGLSKWIFVAAVSLALPVRANIYTFETVAGATDPAGDPVSAEVILNISANSMVVTLTNLEPNIKNVGQAISSLFFSLNQSSSNSIDLANNTSTTISGSLVTIGSSGTQSAGTLNNAAVKSKPTDTTHWTTDSAGPYGNVGKNQLFLNDLNGNSPNHNGPDQTILGPPDASGNYTTLSGSIYNNTPHNPFIENTASFTIASAGLLSTTTVSSVQVGFGTNACAPLVRTHIPEPGTLVLFGAGVALMGGVFRRRRRAGSYS